MSSLRRYLLGVLAVGAAGTAAAASGPSGLRDEVGAGVVLGLLVQAPLGWWTLRSIGSERFHVVWVGGTLLRLTVVGLAALVLVRVYHWEAGALLLTLVASVLALLLVEAFTAAREHSRSK